jgi:hypothetical protein
MKTDTLSLIKTVQPFKSIVKDRLFYNRFEYSIGFQLDEATCLRESLDHDRIDRMIERRIAWREISQQRLAGNIKSSLFPGSATILARRQKEITEETVSNLHKLADILLISPSDFKLVVSIDQGHVYTNDLALIDQINMLPGVTQKSYSQAVICRPKDTIQLKEPNHQFRSYFKITKITQEQKDQLISFLANQQTVRLGPALQHWTTMPFSRTQDYFFVDHDGMAWLTMLSLVRPGIIRKTMQIIQAK